MTYFNSDPKPPKKEKKKPVPLKRTAIKKNYKPSGELKMFQEIWNERNHICESCGASLYEFGHELFHHIKGKGKYPELRLEKSNIKILCFDCHYKIHNR